MIGSSILALLLDFQTFSQCFSKNSALNKNSTARRTHTFFYLFAKSRENLAAGVSDL